ncbi:MAG: ABC transporter ATP-binding protein [Spirochaetales bacterium]|jgi:iron(III) transport system ATP-binding protein|nr:ABC transporter ATP-binding protein [Spirochaetales bacterium]
MEIRIKGLRKHFVSEGKTIKALDDVDITIPANTIFTLLGPSGCGKTTLLRCIVGLETPDAGEIRIGDEIVWSSSKNIYVPTEKRKLGMVFQTYAIWPHMNVFDNVAYPLQNQKVPKDEIRERVAKTLAFVQLEGYEGRPATNLSGGQQQRVALARALVAEPGVILFDEPLSNLDAKLREETRKELKTFLSELEITAVYVTHDRVEALALSDTIAVMRAGRIIETGEPKKIYFGAESRFVADFIGRANLVPAVVKEQTPAETIVECALGRLACKKAEVSGEVTLCVRPEFIHPQKGAGEERRGNIVRGKIETLIFIGDAYEGEIRCGDILLLARLDPEMDFAPGDAVFFEISSGQCLLVSK